MALAFDFDGVLVDTREENIVAINSFAKKYDFPPVSEEEYVRMAACNFYEYWQMLLGEKAPSFFLDLHVYPRAHPKLLPGMRDILVNYQPAIVSSNATPVIRTVLKSYDIKLEIYGGDYEKSKVKKLSSLKKIPDIFVTDTSGDVHEGRIAGYIVIAVTWGLGTRKMLEDARAHHIVHTPEELQEKLVEIIAQG